MKGMIILEVLPLQERYGPLKLAVQKFLDGHRWGVTSIKYHTDELFASCEKGLFKVS